MVASNTRNYKQDTGESLYRRSLYTLWKRQAPPASMDIFDGPTREVCVVRRERTNTPHAGAGDDERSAVRRGGACAGTAGDAGVDAGDVDGAIDFMTVRVLARAFTPAEREIVRGALSRTSSRTTGRTRRRRRSCSPSAILRRIERFLRPELAALTMVANQIFSLDEALNK